MFIAALFPTANRCKQSKCPSTDECTNKIWSIYATEYYYSPTKRDGFLMHATAWMNLECIM